MKWLVFKSAWAFMTVQSTRNQYGGQDEDVEPPAETLTARGPRLLSENDEHPDNPIGPRCQHGETRARNRACPAYRPGR